MPYIGDILIEEGEEAFNGFSDIKEMFELGGTQPGGGDSFSLEAAEAVLVYLIDWRKRRGFIRWLLGFSYADKGAPYRLHRENPQCHPQFPELTATTVTLTSIAPKANTSESKPAVPANRANYPSVLVGNTISKSGYYDSCFATVRFTRRNWQFYPDERIVNDTDELDRNCLVTPTPVVELLQAEGGTSQLRWSETSAPVGSPPVGGPPISFPEYVITNIFAERVSKVKLILEWNWVPESYLSNDSSFFFPQKLFDCVGRVNDRPFLGKPAGTLLMDAPKMDRFRFPVSTFDAIGGYYGWNISIPITYFNPTLGVPDTNPLDNAKARGHRTMPWRANGLWYGCTREKTDARFLEEIDFTRLLSHIDKP